MDLRANLRRLIAERNTSARAVSLRAGLGETYLRDLFKRPDTKPSVEAIQSLARALDVPATALICDDSEGSRSVPLLGYVGAGAAIMPYDVSVLEYIEPPPDCPEGAFGLRIVGDSQWPLFEDGEILICVTAANLLDLLNRYCVVDLADGRRLLKRLERSSAQGWRLTSLNAPPIDNVSIASAARIEWRRPPR